MPRATPVRPTVTIEVVNDGGNAGEAYQVTGSVESPADLADYVLTLFPREHHPRRGAVRPARGRARPRPNLPTMIVPSTIFLDTVFRNAVSKNARGASERRL